MWDLKASQRIVWDFALPAIPQEGCVAAVASLSPPVGEAVVLVAVGLGCEGNRFRQDGIAYWKSL